jgi:ribosome-associated protein
MRVVENTMPHDEKSIRIGKTVIPAHAIRWQFSRSQGPGGQHVNKTNSRAELRIDIQQTDFLAPAVAQRLRAHAGNRVTTAGELVLTSQRFREQNRNVNDCLAKLSALLIKALDLPKTRRATRPTRASKTRRLERKKHRSATKKLRRKIMD